MRFFVHDSFRWRDLDAPDHTTGAWDITLSRPSLVEPVECLDANAVSASYELLPATP